MLPTPFDDPFADDPFADAPPGKASVRRHSQQIDEQHFGFNGSDPENHDFESDLDSQLSGCRIDQNSFTFLNNWPPPPPQCGAGSADFEVCPTPSLVSGYSDSDHSTIGPLSPPSDFDVWGPEADECKEDELFSPVERIHAALGSLNDAFPGSEVAFGTLDTFAHPPSFPYPSPCAWSGYGPQYMDGAATADVRRPPLGYGCPVVGSFPAPGAAQFTAKPRPEEDLSHTDTGAPWLHGGSMYNSGEERFPPDASGTINPTFLSIPFTAGSHCSQLSLHGQEQLQEHHYGVAPAGALGLGSGIQVSGYQDEMETPPSFSGPYPNLHATGLTHINKARKSIPSKKPATSTGKEKRKQPTEKIFHCSWPGCSRAFARTNNWKQHMKGVHHKCRDHLCTVAGCPKAEPNKGFSRKYDLIVHMEKRHPDSGSGSMPAA